MSRTLTELDEARRMDTSGIHLSLFVDSSPSSRAKTVMSSAPPSTSIRSSRMICESATAGLVSSTVAEDRRGSFKPSSSLIFEPSALPIVENIGEMTSRKAITTLAIFCRGLILLKIILT
jgi:hypothetical protein